MKLYLKQKVFSWKDKSNVKDELGNDKYYIEGKVLQKIAHTDCRNHN